MMRTFSKPGGGLSRDFSSVMPYSRWRQFPPGYAVTMASFTTTCSRGLAHMHATTSRPSTAQHSTRCRLYNALPSHICSHPQRLLLSQSQRSRGHIQRMCEGVVTACASCMAMAQYNMVLREQVSEFLRQQQTSWSSQKKM